MSQPSRSKVDWVEVPFYPDDLSPKMQQLLAILNDLDHRYETDRWYRTDPATDEAKGCRVNLEPDLTHCGLRDLALA